MCSVTAAMMGLAAMQGYSSYRSQNAQYKAQAAAYDAQADAARQNARIADQQRSQIADQYAQKQQQLDAKRKLIIGQQNAAAGASGLTGGSVLDANAAAIDQWRTDSMNLLGNQRNDTKIAYINQVNYLNQASQAQAAAANTRSQAKSARISSLLNTALSMYGAYKTFGGVSSKASSQTMQARSGFNGDLASGNLTYTTPTSMYQSAGMNLPKLNTGIITSSKPTFNTFMAPKKWKGFNGWN